MSTSARTLRPAPCTLQPAHLLMRLLRHSAMKTTPARCVKGGGNRGDGNQGCEPAGEAKSRLGLSAHRWAPGPPRRASSAARSWRSLPPCSTVWRVRGHGKRPALAHGTFDHASAPTSSSPAEATCGAADACDRRPIAAHHVVPALDAVFVRVCKVGMGEVSTPYAPQARPARQPQRSPVSRTVPSKGKVMSVTRPKPNEEWVVTVGDCEPGPWMV